MCLSTMVYRRRFQFKSSIARARYCYWSLRIQPPTACMPPYRYSTIQLKTGIVGVEGKEFENHKTPVYADEDINFYKDQWLCIGTGRYAQCVNRTLMKVPWGWLDFPVPSPQRSWTRREDFWSLEITVSSYLKNISCYLRRVILERAAIIPPFPSFSSEHLATSCEARFC